MNTQKQNPSAKTPETPVPPAEKPVEKPLERGGRKGPEPTRYGDWELNGKCVDF